MMIESYLDVKKMILEKSNDLKQVLLNLQDKTIPVVDIQSEIAKCNQQKEEVLKLVREKERIEACIESLPNKDHYEILKLRYIDENLWVDIVKKFGRTWKTAFNLDKKAKEQLNLLNRLGLVKKTEIEVIKSILWAVHFSELGHIEATILNHPKSACYGVLFDHGLIVLNKDNPDYPLIKKLLIKHMRTSSHLLETAKTTRKLRKNLYQILFLDLIDVELVRRSIYAQSRGVKSG